MSATAPTPSQELYVHIGAPEPFIFRLRSASGLVAFDGSLKFTYKNDAGTVTLGVGSGITLSTDEGVANARVSVQLTIEQSRAIPEGAFTQYELQRTVGSLEKVLFMGAMIGEGGVNVDG